jgi:N-acetylneuraminic acid mutarotase
MTRISLLYMPFTIGVLAFAACGENAMEPEPTKTLPSTPPAFAVASNSWITRADLPSTERYWMATAAVNNAVGQSVLYVIGGKTSASDAESSGGSLSKVQAYNVATNTWSFKASLPKPLYWMNGAGVINGKIYVSGGVASYHNHRAELYMYNPAANTWSRKHDMPHPAWRGVTGVINNQLYVLPGCDQDETGNCLLLVPFGFYRYNPATDRWTKLPTPPSRRINGIAGVIGGKFYVAGGSDGIHGLTRVDVFDPATNRWTTRTPMPEFRTWAAGAALQAKLYVIGGVDPGGFTRKTSVYDPATDTWTDKALTPTARHAIAASRVVLNGQGRIELVGGTRPGNNVQYIP